ncbi:hypothetical protein [Capnocytophaga felis]|uniref:DUF3575 domain-containing protein n=1 Tax=Capnocytophaga felis TaxID=2267611 RepID=A0A5M4BAU0_9FLAO|nr:hypothetical protein [Capnocytophaga felis]GET46422.1 hypothetical protein RCZ01_17240 [Capnocytophaga felis]GET48311.1 hypothetical protein RCZ02_11420 [Capnocytophaga felis]
MKKIFYTIIFCLPFLGHSQSTELKKQFGIEASILSLGASYELPVSTNILAEFSAGMGAANIKDYGLSMGVNFGEYTPYTKIGLRRYYNRDNRVRKGKDISYNRGNFVGIQNKILYGNDALNAVTMINELHWGIQTEIAKNLLFSFHVGLGHYYRKSDVRTDSNNYYSPIAPTLGLKIEYILF